MANPKGRTHSAALVGLGLAVLGCGIAAAMPAESVGPSTGGAGGRTIVVSSLADDGPQTLRQVLQATPGDAVIVFERCGSIALTRRLIIVARNLTIDGSTCQGEGGVEIRGAPVTIRNSSNVVLTHLAIRMGLEQIRSVQQADSWDAVEIDCSRRITLDHLSIYWATDENLSIFCYGPLQESRRSEDIIVQHTVVAEALRSPVGGGGRQHSMGVLVSGAVHDVMFFRNLFVSNADRNVFLGPGPSPPAVGTTRVQIVNNLIYHTVYAIRAGDSRHGPWGWEVDVISNVNKAASTPYLPAVAAKSLILVRADNRRPIALHLSGNLVPSRSAESPSESAVFGVDGHGADTQTERARLMAANVRFSPTPLAPLGEVHVLPALEVEDAVLAEVGRQRPCRDELDARVVANVMRDSGQVPVDRPDERATRMGQKCARPYQSR